MYWNLADRSLLRKRRTSPRTSLNLALIFRRAPRRFPRRSFLNCFFDFFRLLAHLLLVLLVLLAHFVLLLHLEFKVLNKCLVFLSWLHFDELSNAFMSSRSEILTRFVRKILVLLERLPACLVLVSQCLPG